MPDPIHSKLISWASAQLSADFDEPVPVSTGTGDPRVHRALQSVVKQGVEDVLRESLPEDPKRRKHIRAALLKGDVHGWPLLDGTALVELPRRVRTWVTVAGTVTDAEASATGHDEDESLVVRLCAAILHRVHGEATRGKGTLAGHWNDFKAMAGIDQRPRSASSTVVSASGPLQINSDINNLVQVEKIENLHISQAVERHSFGDEPLSIGRIPHSAASRQQRVADATLTAGFDDEDGTTRCHIFSGIGGVGKTQLAASFARRYWDSREVDLRVWVNAANRQSIIDTFARAGTVICGADPADGKAAVSEFLSWLERPTVPKWLIVLDDLSDPEDLNDLWPPVNPRGRTIVTTRRRDTALEADGRVRTDIRPFTPEEAGEYLAERLRHNARTLEGAAALAEELGGLPLALAQASAYLLDQPGLTCADYHDLLTERTVELAELSPESIPDEYGMSIAATFSLAIERADPDHPKGLATQLLEMAGMLDPGGIPVAVFTNPMALAMFVASNRNEFKDSPAIVREVNKVLARLHRFSLIDFDGEIVRIHSLVQRSAYDGIDPEKRTPFAQLTGLSLQTALNELDGDFASSALLRANIARLRTLEEDALFSVRLNEALKSAGLSLANWGRYSEAAAYFAELQGECKARLGADHRDTLEVEANHGSLLGQADDWYGALEILEGLLPRMAGVHGRFHPSTFTLRANIIRNQAVFTTSSHTVEMFEALVADAVRELGPEHPQTVRYRMNLDMWRHRAGTASDDAELVDILHTAQRSYEPNDAFTIEVRTRLADRRGASGDAAGAVAEYESLLADVSGAVGDERPEILEARLDLARWRAEAGDPDRAMAELEVLTSDMEDALGPHHSLTIGTRSEVVKLKGRVGDLQGAAAVYERLFDDAERFFGSNSMRTIDIVNDLIRSHDPSGGIGAAMVIGGWRRTVKRLATSSETGEARWNGLRDSVYAHSVFDEAKLSEIGLGALPATHREAMIDMLQNELIWRVVFRRAQKMSERELLKKFHARANKAPYGSRDDTETPIDPDFFHIEFKQLCSQVRWVAQDLLRFSEQAAQ